MIQSENETAEEPESAPASGQSQEAEDGFAGRGITRLTAAERDPIGAELKRLYDDAATEPLPTELLDLLAQLEELERAEAAEDGRR